MDTKHTRLLTHEEWAWLHSHPECKCELTGPLIKYGAKYVFNLRKLTTEESDSKPTSFFDDFIVAFEDNSIEIWGVSSIEAISELIKS